MRPLLLLFLLAAPPLPAEAPPSTPLPVARPGGLGMSPEVLAEIDPAVKQLIADQKLTGASILVLRKGQIVYEGRFGHRDVESGARMTKDTLFRIYSMSKAITSAAALLLMEEGKLSLDDPIAKHLPEFKDLTVWNADGPPVAPLRPPTVRDLLRHTAGFSSGSGGTPVDKLYGQTKALDRDNTLAEMCTALAGIPLLYQPGTRWVYGVNTDILARVVEVASGQPFDTFLQTRFFTPLGMPDTGFHVPPDKVQRFSTVYSDKGAPLESFKTSRFLEKPARLSGGGGLVSTINDYARFLQMIANHGTLGGKRYLKEETVALMTSNQLPPEIPAISFGEQVRHGVGFGLGFSARTAPDKRWDPNAAPDEFGWGGMASTHYWVSPKDELIVITMEQTLPYNWNLEHALKPIIYRAIPR